MASIVYFDFGADFENNPRPRGEARAYGMKESASMLKAKLQVQGTRTDEAIDEIVEFFSRERDELSTVQYKAEYLGEELRHDGRGYYYEDNQGNEVGVTITTIRDRNRENMVISVPRKNQIVGQGRYLDRILSDLDGLPDVNAKKDYLLGTILFRRCR